MWHGTKSAVAQKWADWLHACNFFVRYNSVIFFGKFVSLFFFCGKRECKKKNMRLCILLCCKWEYEKVVTSCNFCLR